MASPPTNLTSRQMIQNNEIEELYRLWGRLPYSALNLIDQRNSKFVIEFSVIPNLVTALFLDQLKEITIKKHPSGSVSYIGHASLPEKIGIQSAKFLTSNIKKYRLDFSESERIDEEKLKMFLESLKIKLKESLNEFEKIQEIS